MKVSHRTRVLLAIRREQRRRLHDGWEYVGEGGGSLWELKRGVRLSHRITDAAVAVDGKGVWVKIEAFPEGRDGWEAYHARMR